MENSPLLNEQEFEVFKSSNKRKIIYYILAFFVFCFLFNFLFLAPPGDFPVGSIIRVEKGSSLRSVSSLFEKQRIIRSRVLFESFVIIFGGEKHIISADYLFENKLPVWEVAMRIAKGEHYAAKIVVTIPEGFDVNQISNTFAQKLTNFNNTQFLLKAKILEGYLFPDTYFFLNDDNEDIVLQSMNDNFEKKIAPFVPVIISLGKNERDIVIMASIIEKEAKGNSDRGIISGILWRRINIGMPLQVDAVPDTYKIKGLPKSPIGNPGLLAIKASLYPQSSPYLYYLHDKIGNTYYAKSFAEHKQNIAKYLSARGGSASGGKILP